jgi:histidyl-tRNA synthetase
MSIELPSPTEFIKVATRTARHFGFDSLDEVKARTKENAKPEDVKKPQPARISAADRKVDSLHGILTSGVASYFENNLHNATRPILFSSVEEVPRTGELAIALHALGVHKSIAETLLIQTMRSILTDVGVTDHVVRINSQGDRESVNRYTRELTNFFKKRMDEMTPQARDLMREHVLVALGHLIEREHELAHRAPSPMEHLSDQSRKHFREIVEYLDMAEIPYEIDTKLIGNHLCYSDALFSIQPAQGSGTESPFVIRGGRYDEFVKRLTKQNVPATGAVMILRSRKAPSRIPKHDMPERSVFVVQLGFGPKIRSLMLLEDLKRADIAAYQELASDSLSDQLRLAERLNVPYSLIVGQKEYVEGTVIVRDMRSRSQESVPLDGVVSHMRRLVRR